MPVDAETEDVNPGSLRSLADDLRSRTDAALRRLLVARPDLARPVPSDIGALAARSTTRASTARAIDGLDSAHLSVLTACAVLDDPATPEAVANLLGVDESLTTTLAECLDRLWELALLWGDDDRRASRTVPEVLGPHVAGLGPPRVSLGLLPLSPNALTEILDTASEPARAVLGSVTWGPPTALMAGSTKAAAAAQWLAARGVVHLEDETMILPRETALHLRGGRLLADLQLTPPSAEAPSAELTVVDRASGGAASDLLGLIDDLLASWSIDPPRVLKTGGVAARDLAATARGLDLDPRRTAFILDLALSAGLLADDGEDPAHWAPTPDYDAWLDEPSGHRWARLATAWWSTTRDPALAGRHLDGKLVPALSPAAHRPAIRELRQDILRLLGGDGHPGPNLPCRTADDLVALLRWHRPRRLPADPEVLLTAVAAVLDQATTLGLVAAGALTSGGRALLDQRHPSPDALDALAHAVNTHVPDPVTHVLLQADLTAIVPGPTAGSLGRFLRLAADLESRGGASVHRFSEASIRRCLDAGWTVEDVLAALQDASSTPVPQALDYLVRDTGRRHGRVRVSTTRSALRVDEPSLLEAVLTDRRLAPLQLRRLAPTVAISPADPAVVIGMLADAGHSAVAESSSGAIVLRATQNRRARPLTSTPTTVRSIDATTAASLVAELRLGEAATERSARSGAPALIPTGDPTTSMVVLREAAADRRGVWIGYADGTGAVRRFLFQPESVEHGRVHGIADGIRKTLSIHRVTGVAAE